MSEDGTRAASALEVKLRLMPDGNPNHKGFYNRWYLPHFDEPGKVQFITYRLYDSLPKEVTARLYELPPEERPSRLLEELDAGYGKCWLRRPEIAAVVQGNLLHFNEDRYRLFAWCVMSNHVHVLAHLFNPQYTLASIVHSWKSFTANGANKVLGRSGQFWMDDYFDSAARTEEDVVRIADYIENNPVAAGMVRRPEDWRFSSAGYRATHSL